LTSTVFPAATWDPSARLEAVSPLEDLSLGYALVTSADGRALMDSRQVRVGTRVSIRLRRGGLVTIVESKGDEGEGAG
jgi:exonuclease VII large subunit